jgi:N6-adenosine-specific RNA methylase IME4
MAKNKGAVPGKTGRKGKPVLDTTPKLKDLGLSKTQSSQWQALAAIPQEQFEEVVADARDKVDRAVRNAVREVQIRQEQESYRARTHQGCTVDDLIALIGKAKFGVIVPDFPWPFETWSHKGKQRSAERHYQTWPLERILEFATIIGQLAADDCALFLWTVWSQLSAALDVIKAAGFDYKTVGFVWVKTLTGAECITLAGEGLHLGTGLSGPRANTEVCLLAKRGEPRRLAADVDQVIVAPVGERSAKPDEAYRRIERLYPGPRLELFARRSREHWTCWGDEIPPATFNDDSAQAVTAQPLAAAISTTEHDDIPDFLLRSTAKRGAS